MSDDGFSELPNRDHNAPGVEMLPAEELRQRLLTTHADIIDRAQQLLDAEHRMPVIDDDISAGKIGDYIKLVTAAMKDAEGLRIQSKEPYMQSGRAVDGVFKKIGDPLLALKMRVGTLLGRYLQEKENRAREERRRLENEARAREEEARRVAEVAAAAAKTERDLATALNAEIAAMQATSERIVATEAAQVKPAELSRTRGDYGSVASLRATWDFEIENFDLIPRAYLMINESSLRAHVKARLKDRAPGPIPGVRFFEKKDAAVR